VRVPVWLASLIVAGAFSSQGWLVLAVIDLKSDVAAVKAVLHVENKTNNVAQN